MSDFNKMMLELMKLNIKKKGISKFSGQVTYCFLC